LQATWCSTQPPVQRLKQLDDLGWVSAHLLQTAWASIHVVSDLITVWHSGMLRMRMQQQGGSMPARIRRTHMCQAIVRRSAPSPNAQWSCCRC
jgi:hypothetical protein